MFNPSDIVLEAKHVVKQFPASDGRLLTACNDVTLNVYRGKTLGIVGRAAAENPPLSDAHPDGYSYFREILLHGKDILHLKGEERRLNRQNLQMVFQDPLASFNPKMKVMDILTEPLRNFGRLETGRPGSESQGATAYGGAAGGFLSTGIPTACLADSGSASALPGRWRWSRKSGLRRGHQRPGCVHSGDHHPAPGSAAAGKANQHRVHLPRSGAGSVLLSPDCGYVFGTCCGGDSWGAGGKGRRFIPIPRRCSVRCSPSIWSRERKIRASGRSSQPLDIPQGCPFQNQCPPLWGAVPQGKTAAGGGRSGSPGGVS